MIKDDIETIRKAMWNNVMDPEAFADAFLALDALAALLEPSENATAEQNTPNLDWLEARLSIYRKWTTAYETELTRKRAELSKEIDKRIRQDERKRCAEKEKALTRIANMNEETPTPEINLYSCKLIARRAIEDGIAIAASNEDRTEAMKALPRLAALLEPNEDVKALAESICIGCIDAAGPNMFFDHDNAATMIQAYAERIRQDERKRCADRYIAHVADNYDLEEQRNIRHIIEEATE